MAHSDCRWTCGCAGKTEIPWEQVPYLSALRWWYTKRCYSKCTYLYLYTGAVVRVKYDTVVTLLYDRWTASEWLSRWRQQCNECPAERPWRRRSTSGLVISTWVGCSVHAKLICHLHLFLHVHLAVSHHAQMFTSKYTVPRTKTSSADSLVFFATLVGTSCKKVVKLNYFFQLKFFS